MVLKKSKYSKVRIVQEGGRIVIEEFSPESRHAFLWEFNQKSGKLTPLGAELSGSASEQIEQLFVELQAFLGRNRPKGEAPA